MDSRADSGCDPRGIQGENSERGQRATILRILSKSDVPLHDMIMIIILLAAVPLCFRLAARLSERAGNC